jgi:hypothetical protein
LEGEGGLIVRERKVKSISSFEAKIRIDKKEQQPKEKCAAHETTTTFAFAITTTHPVTALREAD